MTIPDAAREIDRERLAKVVATCVSVPAWSGMSEPRRMACRQAVDSILAALTAQGFVIVRWEDLAWLRWRVFAGVEDTGVEPVLGVDEPPRLARIDAALTGQAGEKP